jgi:LPXTG-motif cell wall-anchored protein
MKKILLICLVLVLTFSLSSVCFAATTTTTTTTTAGTINLTTEQNAGSYVYPDTEPNALSAAGATDKSGASSSVIVADETTPKALPKTGGIPAEAFYAIGAILVIGALVILMRKPKTAEK